MPARNNKPPPPPPPVMTWKNASLILGISVLFDLIRAAFEMLWFFAPALAGVFCTIWGAQYIPSAAAGVTCTAAAGVVGFFAAAPIGAVGVVLAAITGMLGWGIIGLWVVLKNRRLVTNNTKAIVWFIFGVLISEIPLVGVAPAMTGTLWRLLRTQIKKEEKDLETYKSDYAVQIAAQKKQLLIETRARIAVQQKEEALLLEEALRNEQSSKNQGLQTQNTLENLSNEESAQNDSQENDGGNTPPADTSEVQFETIKDALSDLNSKINRTPDENRRLLRAREIMQTVSILPFEQNDAVLSAAYERARLGQKVSDSSSMDRHGFVFQNLNKSASMMARPKTSREGNPPKKEII